MQGNWDQGDAEVYIMNHGIEEYSRITFCISEVKARNCTQVYGCTKITNEMRVPLYNCSKRRLASYRIELATWLPQKGA